MLKALVKQRWMPWEHRCLKMAFKHRIQLKIIAAALGKSVASISKKIHKLGLRGAMSMPGRLKGRKYEMSTEKKVSCDKTKMTEIMAKHAPLRALQKSQMALRFGRWTIGKPPPLPNLTKKTFVGRLTENEGRYSSSPPWTPLQLEGENIKPLGFPRVSGEPLYISLRYVEEWARAKGFHELKPPLQEKGISYWREGKYFSKAQILVYLNGIRFEKRLEPLVAYEEEIGD